MRRTWISVLVGVGWGVATALGFGQETTSSQVQVGFGQTDITPDISGPKPVWVAGYGHNRRATAIHDHLFARAAVVSQGPDRVALVAVDLVGLQYAEVKRIRERLPEYRYVLVASTHNHEGPDVIGIWGPSPVQRGVDDAYLQIVVNRVVEAVRAAEKQQTAVRAVYGTASNEGLLRDSREPQVKDGVLRALRFHDLSTGRPVGILAQFSCHPESLGSKNTEITADFPYYTLQRLEAKEKCPVVYFSGAVGGLMTNPSEFVRSPGTPAIPDETFTYAREYGEAVADVFDEALRAATPVNLSPLRVAARPIAIPVDNPVFRAAREIGVLRRPGLLWNGDAESLQPWPESPPAQARLAMESEVSCVRLGEVTLAGIPGELYPELVYGKVPSPAEAGADFPDSPVEPSVQELLPSGKWLLIGLANDELGYIIPRRQWDDQPPFCYGRPRSQYGEINSCGPEVAAVLMGALQRRVQETGAR